MPSSFVVELAQRVAALEARIEALEAELLAQVPKDAVSTKPKKGGKKK